MENQEETFEDAPTKYPIMGSLESLKSKYFNKVYEEFRSELLLKKFPVFTASYKFVDDFNNKPDFIIKNLLNGFCQQLEDKRKYLFVRFICRETHEKSYILESFWITNSTLPLKEIIPDKYDDFTWNEINYSEESQINLVINQFTSEDDYIATSYLH